MAKRSSNRNPKRAKSPAKAKGIVKNAIGILFVPVVIAVTRGFYNELISVEALTEPARYFLLGFGAYIFTYIVLFKLDYFYVLGHEFVHAVFVWVFGGKVISIKVKKDRGSVTSTKKNIFIDLAPYLIPIYTILITLLYLLGSSFWNLGPYARQFILLAGFSFAFHIVMTIDKMKIEQPDFLDFGYLNSLILIYAVNVILMGLFFGLLFPDFLFKNFMAASFENARELYINLFYQLF